MSTEINGDHNLGLLIKALLKERMLSMRKLSALTGIDTATISRIANNKQKATPSHLQLLANHLDVPPAKLIQAAGYNLVLSENNDQSDMYQSIDAIQEILVSSNFLDHEFTVEKIHQELAKYEHFSLTKEGEQKILEEFETKVEEVRGAGPFIIELNKMFKSFREENLSIEKRTILGSVLLYFILSTDIIPDYVFPFGYLDDCLAVQIGLERLSKLEENNV
ncbi:DNA-binding protein [Heyndrickxia shackletonii]|uniref:DNA-binding protein n=1 Tax=Heyndrickxia shackletonii TaxID=157838 RepID=A0A0Q3TGI0_9BACI|nr:helix-turn-helix domain-containing protein [Heyndrickxia shackletonii]KQL53152.1 DNA-binding protein [Heyndrickxia shackletonii]NEZ00663.1 helix-turn-helix domain-containing protein [Heyndrickxia shackletonii]